MLGAHNPKVVSSNLAPATWKPVFSKAGFFLLRGRLEIFAIEHGSGLGAVLKNGHGLQEDIAEFFEFAFTHTV